MDQTVTVATPLPEGSVPDLIHLVPAGSFKGVDGRGPYKLDDPEGVIRASMLVGKLPIDETHATDLAGPKGHPAPARGWIVGMEARPDGLWARVEWTAAGRALLADKAYRAISPVIVADKGNGALRKVLRASLTNDPNLSLTTLHAKDATSADDAWAVMREVLGLPDDADENAIVAEAKVAVAAKRDRAADAERIARAVALLQGEDAGAASAQLQARGGDEALRRENAELQARVIQIQDKHAHDEAVRAVDDACRAGKVTPALRERFLALFLRDPDDTREMFARMPTILQDVVHRRPSAAAGSAVLDPSEREVCELMGIDPKAFAESKSDLERRAL